MSRIERRALRNLRRRLSETLQSIEALQARVDANSEESLPLDESTLDELRALGYMQ